MNLMGLVVTAVMFVVLGFTLSIGQTMLQQVNTTAAASGGGVSNYAVNSTQYAMSGVNTLAYWLPTIALAIAAGFVISILIVYLLGSIGGGRREGGI
jgi:hypothetical protein